MSIGCKNGRHDSQAGYRVGAATVPSLHQTVNGQPAVFFDAPGGTQVPQRVIDAIANYLSTSNANTGGAFLTSQRTDQMIADARAAMADFLNCASDEVVFGANMTTLTFALSRAMGRELKSGDELLVTCLDHDANVSPWVCLEERGVKVRTADIKPADCTLDMFDLSAKIRRSTRWLRWDGQPTPSARSTMSAKLCGWRTLRARWPSSTRCITRRMDRSTCRRWIATSWPAPATSSSGRTWAFFTASASSCSGCVLTSCAPAPSSCPTAGRRARRTTNAWPD